MCSTPVICPSTCSAGVATSDSTSLAEAPGNGIRTFAIVTLICGSSSRGVTRTAKTPRSAATSATSGVSCEPTKNLAMRPEMPIGPARSGGLLQLHDPERLHHVFLVDRLGGALLHLADEVLLERDLGDVHPLPLAEPVDVARRHLRQRDERDAGVAHVGEADRVPGRLLGGRLAVDRGADVVRGRG